MIAIRVILLSISLLIAFSPFSSSHANIKYKGVNLASAGFAGKHLPGKYGTHYLYPSEDDVDYFLGKGMNTFRLAFRWERLQHSPYAELNPKEIARIKKFVGYTSHKKAFTVLDVHNYARYYGNIIGENVISTEVFADFWSKLAQVFKDDQQVIFGLMKSPISIT